MNARARAVVPGIALTFFWFVTAASAAAQSFDFQVTPYAAVYSPLTRFTVPVDIDGELELFIFDPNPGPALGARIGTRLKGPLSLEGSFAYGLSDARVGTLTTSSVLDGNVWTASARLLLAFGDQGGPIAFHVGGGLSYTKRGGEAYRDASTSGGTGGLFAAGANFDVSNRLSVRLDAENVFYDLGMTIRDPSIGELVIAPQFQSDLLLTFGLNVRLGPGGNGGGA